MRFCTGRGRSPCQRRGDVYLTPHRGHCVQDAIELLEHWLAWYEALPWWRRLWL